MDPKEPTPLEIPSTLVIPEISNNELQKLYSQIKPIIDIEDQLYRLREFNTHELREPLSCWNHSISVTIMIPTDALIPIQDFKCLSLPRHYNECTDPPIAEVLPQIPKDILGRVDFFEVLRWPKVQEDYGNYPKIIEKGFHLSTIRLYRFK